MSWVTPEISSAVFEAHMVLSDCLCQCGSNSGAGAGS
jgi:hypothetical protein